jgi:hypothetical protein
MLAGDMQTLALFCMYLLIKTLSQIDRRYRSENRINGFSGK